jgi:integrase
MPSKKKTRGKGEGGLYRRGDGLWCAVVELPAEPGKRRRKVVARKLKPDVVAELARLKAQLAENGDLPTGRSLTTAQWMRYWLDEISAKRSRPLTIGNQTNHIENHIIPVLGTKPLGKLQPDDVLKLHKALEAKDMTSGSIRQVHGTLSKALADAKKLRKVTFNACDFVDRPAENNTKRTSLTLEQAIKLLSHLGNLPVADRAMWATFLLTGARRGEVMGLEAERIEFRPDGGGVIDFAWQLQRIADISKASKNWEYRHVEKNLYLAKPKSDSGTRIVPLVEPLRSILAMHMQDRTSGFVFTKPDGSPVPPEFATLNWKPLLAAAGIDGAKIRLHDSRHTTVDLLLAAGVPIQTVRDIVGHADEKQTLAYRTRKDLPQLEAAMHKMSRLLTGEPTE